MEKDEIDNITRLIDLARKQPVTLSLTGEARLRGNRQAQAEGRSLSNYVDRLIKAHAPEMAEAALAEAGEGEK